MIRDRLLVGETTAELTLSKNITKKRQSEERKKLQRVLRQASEGSNEVNMDKLKYKVKPKRVQKWTAKVNRLYKIPRSKQGM